VATSFPAKLTRANAGQPFDDYDQHCVKSWASCGFRILGINAPEEIRALAARYDGVEFIAAERNARTLFGRTTPFIADMMAILAAQPEPVLGIVNCDLLFEPVPAWDRLIAPVAQKTVFTGQRLDVRTLMGGALHPYFPGFDYFFFDRSAAIALSAPSHLFSMGLPWWDYWCPLSLAMRGYRLQCLARPAVLHLAHESQTDARTLNWRRLAVQFAQSLVEGEKNGLSPPPDGAKLMAACVRLAAASDADLERGVHDEEIIRLSELSVPLIGGVPVELESEPANAAPYFADIPARIAAGQGLHHALWEDKQRNYDEAARLYGVALDNAPQDPGVLLQAGNFYSRRGDIQRAALLLKRAVDCVPDNAMLLNSLGSTLGQLGRDGEARACFERALAADPLDGVAYYNLALALFPENRHGEIIRRLEDMLSAAPHFPDGADWLRRIREKCPL
jgi:tetratricopeptide (TPR) repeat protein